MAPPRSPASPKPATPARSGRRRLLKWLAILLISLPLLGLLGLLLASESYSARWQSQVFADLAARMHFQLADGPSPAISWPAGGPFDQRLGYSRLPGLIERLQSGGYHISQQARQSQSMLDFASAGFYPPFQEKNRSGLTIRDCQQVPMYRFLQPQRSFATFGSIPPVVVQSLLFIENRDLLDPRRPWLNPAVNWPRFLRAAWSQLASRLADDIDSAGGSTLATQIEKFRHSPDGMTSGIGEKFRQMVSASLRAYSQGRETLPARQKLVLDYLNNVPLAAARGYGEIHGIGDALWVWFGADFRQTLQALDAAPGTRLPEQALALRQVLALMIAQRRPSWYLLNGRADLEQLTDSHLRLLGEAGIISLPLRDQALATRLQFRDLENQPAVQPQELDKGVIQTRNRLVSQLGLSLYDTDRLDLSVRSTLNAALQQAVTAHLTSLADPVSAARHGLLGHRLLTAEQAPHIRYSFTLFERGTDGNRVRVQTDTTSQLFSINEASKLELGSTAKLRVMATYLEVIAELYRRHAGGDGNPLGNRQFNNGDNLSRWVIEYLQANPGASLEQTLGAALDRRYSASPGERFFTGGGIHTFGNFRKEDNGRRPTLRESLRESINLPFVRLLRDLVQYSTYQASDYQAHLLHDDRDPRRLEYLRRFADREGTDFLGRFWRKYRDKQGEAMLDTLLEGLKPGSVRLAAIHRYLLPEASVQQFSQFMLAQLGSATPPPAKLASLYQQYGRDSYSLSDLGWIARVHPLEMWLVAYRLQNPDASFQQAVAASSSQRVEIYDWLIKTPNRRARDTRIRSMLEVEAFLDLHQRWSRLGYPFGHLVPSLATALGSSGDRPAALAELMGILLNDGRRLPTLHSEQFSFAVGTPYETRLTPLALTGEQVMEPAVARALRSLLAEVVEQGTARRVAGSFLDRSGQPMTIGGKTGTGDNRSESVRGGRVIQSQVRNRTATFVFYLGSHHFGTLTAYVDGEGADGMRFTSALPVQVLRSMAPLLQDYLDNPAACQLPAEQPATEQP